MFFIQGAEISVNTSDTKYYIIQNLSKSISDRSISFSVKTCRPAYVALGCGIMDSYYLYKIVIDRPFNSLNDKRITSRSYIRIGEDIVETKVYYNFQKVLDCNNYKEFYITWNDNTITMGLGLQGNGTLFLKWTSSTKLESIQNVGIRTQIGIGKWIFYTSGNK